MIPFVAGSKISKTKQYGCIPRYMRAEKKSKGLIQHNAYPWHGSVRTQLWKGSEGASHDGGVKHRPISGCESLNYNTCIIYTVWNG